MDASHFPRRRGTVDVVSESTPSRPGPCKGCAPPPPFVPPPELALFSYHQTTKANAVKFMHQSLCNLPITSLIKAISAGFLRGAPHLVCPKISYAKPCNIKRPHETATQRPAKHDTQTNPSLPSMPTLCPKHPSTCHAGPNS
jgi:hypothetical protein